MQDWITTYLTIKMNLTKMHSLLLKKEADQAVELALQIAADARICAKQIAIQQETNKL